MISASQIPAEQKAAAALVRAIRRVMRHPKEGDNLNGGVERFTVHDVHDFPRRLLEEGVTVSGARAR